MSVKYNETTERQSGACTFCGWTGAQRDCWNDAHREYMDHRRRGCPVPWWGAVPRTQENR